MSGLRSNLEAWALGHGAEVAELVATEEPAARAQIRSRRRNRTVAVAAGAAATIVGVAAIASALPRVNEGPAADRLPRHLSELVCGHAWVVDRGTTSFVEEPDFYFDAPQGNWVLTTGDGGAESDFASYTAGQATVAWQGDIDVRHHTIARARVVAVKSGTIVGVTEDQYARIGDDGVALHANAPQPGTCGDTTSGASSGEVTYHLVIQLTRVDDAAIIATIVDPSGAKTVNVEGVEEWLSARADGPATPREPQGSSYQAFLVARPTAQTCEPLQDMLDAGEPLLGNPLTYPVTIPGVQPLALGSLDALAVADASVADQWYFGKAAWLVADDPGSLHQQSMAWDPADFVLKATESPVVVGLEDCLVNFRYAEPSGGMWLVFDGADWAAIGDLYPTINFASASGWQTWVYLGEAD